MKKLFAFFLSMALLSAMVLPAAAETTVLTIQHTRADAKYMLSVPQNQTVSNDEFVSIGTVSVSDTSNFQNRHLKVALTMTNFTGETTTAEVPAFLRVRDMAENVCGNSNDFNLYFRHVDDSGALANDLFSDAIEDPEAMVKDLVVACYLDGNFAPTDTYTATITYTASVENN